MLRIGCLALQGCVERHRAHVEAAGAEFRAVKTAKQFDAVDGFILPGGESTTMLKLIERFELWDVLAAEFAKKPVWGICAGSILLAEKSIYKIMSSCGSTAGSLANQKGPAIKSQDDSSWLEQKSFGILPLTAIRNGYGRQLDSHNAVIDGYEVSFIRAPILKDVDARIEILASHHDDPVWIKDGQNMATSFHPELTFDFPSPMHRAFVDIVQQSR